LYLVFKILLHENCLILHTKKQEIVKRKLEFSLLC